jgi:hypothetical protein
MRLPHGRELEDADVAPFSAYLGELDSTELAEVSRAAQARLQGSFHGFASQHTDFGAGWECGPLGGAADRTVSGTL